MRVTSISSKQGANLLVYLAIAGGLLCLGLLTLWLRFPFYKAAALPVLGIAALYLAKKPLLTILLTIGLVYFPWAELGPITLFRAVAAIAVVGAATDLAIRRVVPRLTSLFPAYLTFTCLIIGSLAFVPQLPLATRCFYLWIRGLLLVLLVVNYVVDGKTLRKAFWVMIAVGSINAAGAILDYMQSGAFTHRSVGFMGDPNALAGILATTIPISASLAIEPGRRSFRVLAFGLTLLMMGGVATTISRGGTVAFLMGLFTLALVNLQRWRWFSALALILVLLVPLVPDYYWDRFANLSQQVVETVDVDQPYLSDRGYNNRAAIAMWREHPVVGVGPGHYPFYVGLARFNLGFEVGESRVAHSLFLQVLSENGTVGFIVFIWLTLVVVFTLWGVWHGALREGNETLRQNAGIIMAMVVAMLTVGMTLNTLYDKQLHLIYGLALCLPLLRDTGTKQC